MPGVSSRRGTRLVLLLVLIFAAVVPTSCRSQRFAHLRLLQTFPDPSPSPCHAAGSDPAPSPGDPKHPIACIDDRDMGAPKYPEVVHAERNAVINWFTVTGEGSIAVVFNDKSPVRHLICGQNKAFCQAVIDNDAVVGPYEYSLTITRGGRKKSIDPTVQVDPGMVNWEQDLKP